MHDLRDTDTEQEDGTVIRDQQRFGCFLEVAGPNDRPDGCLAMSDYPSSCSMGMLPSGQNRRSRWS